MTLLDIFVKPEDNSPMWIEAVESLDKAKERLAELSSETGCEYAVYDTPHGIWVIPFEGDSPSERDPGSEQVSE